MPRVADTTRYAELHDKAAAAGYEIRIYRDPLSERGPTTIPKRDRVPGLVVALYSRALGRIEGQRVPATTTLEVAAAALLERLDL